MLSSLHTHATAADLARVLVCWLAAIVFAQGIAAAHALGQGPLHHHRGDASLAITASPQPRAHHHGASERHHHAPGDASVDLALSHDADVDIAALALTVALALMVFASVRALVEQRVHVLRPALPWSWRTATSLRLLRPPRRG